MVESYAVGTGLLSCTSLGPSLLEPVRQLVQSKITSAHAHTTLNALHSNTIKQWRSSSLWVHEQSNTGKDPSVWVGVLTLHLQASGEDNGGTTGGGGVHWALVEALGLLLSTAHSSHVDNWHNWM